MFPKAIILAGTLASYVSGQTVYLAGDSTMAAKGGGSGTEGWGQYLHYSLKLPVVNNAMGGRSARSFTREGRFDAIGAKLKSGDFVIIEFGHNDGASKPDNGRSDCPGEGAEVCTYTYNGVAETVKTFPAYIEAAAKSFTAKGAHVIVSSQTPNNPDETGVFVDGASRFVALAALAAKTAKVDYVDHGAYSMAAYKPLAVAEVNSYFPNDHTHTAPKGADLVSKAFVRGLVCGNSLLKSHVVNGTSTIPGKCL